MERDFLLEAQTTVFFQNQLKCLFKVFSCLDEGLALRIGARNFLDVADVPIAALPNDACYFLFHSGMLACLGLAWHLDSRVAAGPITASM